MKIIFIGAGEVGRGLASTLCLEKNDIVVVDINEKLLEEVVETTDVMAVTGSGGDPNILSTIGVDQAQLLVAVTDSTEANVLSCSLAKIINPEIRTICRVSTSDYFNEDAGITPASAGIDHIVVPKDECTEAIVKVLASQELKEVVQLSIPDAVIYGFQVAPGSPLVGSQLFNFPRPDLLNKVRICAIWRKGRLIIPRGKERFNNYDEIYVAGSRKHVEKMVAWSAVDEHRHERSVVVGGNPLGLELALSLHNSGISVTLIEPDRELAEKVLESAPPRLTVIHGDPTVSDVLYEAGVDGCDAFISTLNGDESNVLATLLAKRAGAKKVIAVVNKLDYREIVSSMDDIDCCFSPRIAAQNSIINLIKGSNRRIGAMLHRMNAEIYEMTVTPNSRVDGVPIKNTHCPDDCVFAMIIRGNVIVPATGNEVFQVGDRVVIMGTAESLKQTERLFTKKTLF